MLSRADDFAVMGEGEPQVPWEQPWYREMVEVLRAKTSLRAGLDPERANDLLLLYAGMDVYHSLVEVQGCSHDDRIAWTRSTLADQLFGIEGAARG